MNIFSRPRRKLSRSAQPRLELLERRDLLSGMSMPPSEMDAALALVPDSAVTDQAVRSGLWSSPATWQSGRVPGSSDNVLIPTLDTVTVDALASAHTIRVDGTLRFKATASPHLFVDTLVVNMGGSLVIQTSNPATITFTDNGPIDTMWDPMLISRGMISMGTVMLSGAAKTQYLTLAQPAHQGDTTLYLSAVPVNWNVGDELILGGTSNKRNGDEDLHILGITGNQVTVAPLANDHVPLSGQFAYATDVTRNIVFESQNQVDVSRRGHVMFMSNMTNVANVEFLQLGRTDKTQPLSPTNPRGRYAVHFHEIGTDPTMMPAVVTGSTVVGSPGWGFVNHDSFVEFENDTAYNVTGAAFVTEAGDEIGCFMHDLAIHSVGDGSLDVNARVLTQDFGHEGDGFWFQGNGLHTENNIAIGQAHAGFVLYSQGFQLPGQDATQFLSVNLPNPALANGQPTVSVKSVPLFDFRNNVATTSWDAMEVWSQLGIPLAGTNRSVISGFVADNDVNGIRLRYSQLVLIRDSLFLGQGDGSNWEAIHEPDSGLNNIRLINLTVKGWLSGVRFSEQGTGLFLGGGTFDNVHNVEIPSPFASNRSIVISQPTFVTSSDPLHQDIYWVDESDTVANRDSTNFFVPDHVRYNGWQLYPPWQAASYVPLPQQVTSGPLLPPALIGKTNQQLWQTYGLASEGVLPPAAQTITLMTNGTVGKPASYPPFVRLASPEFTQQLSGYQLQYSIGTNKPWTTVPTLFRLKPGWNLLSVVVNGFHRTLFVYGDVTPPTFQLDPSCVLTIRQSDMAAGFTVTGKALDDSEATQNVRVYFGNLDQLPVHTAPDGSQYVILSFTISDLAGNTTPVSLDLTIV
jgi:hypothetical protein